MLAQILGADPREKQQEGAPVEDALEAMVQEFIDASSSGNAKEAAQALRSCIMECGRDNSPAPGAPTQEG